MYYVTLVHLDPNTTAFIQRLLHQGTKAQTSRQITQLSHINGDWCGCWSVGAGVSLFYSLLCIDKDCESSDGGLLRRRR